MSLPLRMQRQNTNMARARRLVQMLNGRYNLWSGRRRVRSRIRSIFFHRTLASRDSPHRTIETSEVVYNENGIEVIFQPEARRRTDVAVKLCGEGLFTGICTRTQLTITDSFAPGPPLTHHFPHHLTPPSLVNTLLDHSLITGYIVRFPSPWTLSVLSPAGSDAALYAILPVSSVLPFYPDLEPRVYAFHVRGHVESAPVL